LDQNKSKPKRERQREAPPLSFGFYVLTKLAAAMITDFDQKILTFFVYVPCFGMIVFRTIKQVNS
jgi:hypothetical protein